jgi:hypothetical protein
MSRVGNVYEKGCVRWTAATPPVIPAGANNGAFAEPIVRTGVGVWEVAPAPSQTFAPQDTFRGRVEDQGTATNIVCTIERVTEVLIRVRAWNGTTGAAVDANISLIWRSFFTA